jgi:hypothetical protein
MKLIELKDEKRPFQVPYVSWHLGRRDRALVKQVFDPFIKQAGKDMIALKGSGTVST